jgi:hypothetical protein
MPLSVANHRLDAAMLVRRSRVHIQVAAAGVGAGPSLSTLSSPAKSALSIRCSCQFAIDTADADPGMWQQRLRDLPQPSNCAGPTGELPWLAKLKLFNIAHFNIGC